MIWGKLAIWRDLARSPPAKVEPRRHLQIDVGERPIYAIGDVHGCLAALRTLEAKITADAMSHLHRPLVVMLGDVVDRGPASAQVIDHLLTTASDFDRICLAGNHELAMGAFLRAPRRRHEWLDFGGLETLLSYGIEETALQQALAKADRLRALVDSHIPSDHRQFLDELPVLLETRQHIFVHAGLRPGIPIEIQHDSDLVWFRDSFSSDYAEFGKTIVHGHTPVMTPLLSQHRICVDTGAYATGRLTAVKLVAGKEPLVLAVGPTTSEGGNHSRG
ncbi:metallophosphoesterase [Devosia sp.]|uniref:metallophosphoesterase n=1 Tax=Devosia sp. TaxID=1871048 RepID=UPI003F71C99A